MRIIKNVKDLLIVKRSKVLNEDLMKILEDIFDSYYNSCQSDYSRMLIHDICNIILLEKGDNPRASIYLDDKKMVRGLLKEYLDQVSLISYGNTSVYRIIIIKNLIIYNLFILENSFDQEIELYLKNQVIPNNPLLI